MRIYLEKCFFFFFFATFFTNKAKITYRDMKNFLKNIGIILVLAGVVCLVVYETSMQVNALLITALVLEVAGILSYMLLNRYLD